ncbi:hypothetical protein [Kitasatospora terrestris]|uniref:Uncharacterized protein n=1 Tax=Kitasatospora terrestris TaxID=258051 RepID=A0ABP9EFM5_9ACTN
MVETPGSGEDRGTTAVMAQTAQEKAAESAATVGRQASEVAGTAKEQAAKVVEEAGTQAQELLGGLREQLGQQAQTQGRRLAQTIRTLAGELEEMGRHGPAGSVTTSLVGRLADGGHQVAGRIEERGPQGLLDDVQDFARRRPGMFLAGAALAGLAVGRTGKGVSTAPDNDSDSGGSSSGSNGPSGDGGSAGVSRATPAPAAGPLPSAVDAPTDPYQAAGQSQPPHITPDPPHAHPDGPPPSGPGGRWQQPDIGR